MGRWSDVTDAYYTRQFGPQGHHSNDIGSRSAKLVLRVAAGFCLFRMLSACCSVADGMSMIDNLRKLRQKAHKARCDCISPPALHDGFSDLAARS